MAVPVGQVENATTTGAAGGAGGAGATAGSGGEGGAIYTQATTIIENSTFTGNTAGRAGTAGEGGNGGAGGRGSTSTDGSPAGDGGAGGNGGSGGGTLSAGGGGAISSEYCSLRDPRLLVLLRMHPAMVAPVDSVAMADPAAMGVSPKVLAWVVPGVMEASAGRFILAVGAARVVRSVIWLRH